MAFQIIRHAFRMVFGNFAQALRVSVGPYLILVLAFGITLTLIAGSGGFVLPATPTGIEEDLSPAAAIMVLLVVVISLFVFSWVAVAWHRFILLEEYPGLLPQIAGRPIWPYLGRSIVYALVLALVALPLMLLLAPLLMGGGGAFSVLVLIGITGLLTYFWLRIAIALPSVAVGKPISMGEAWRASRGMSGTIFGVAFLLMGINGIATVVTNQVNLILPFMGFLLDVALQWTILMLGVSVLTTFYGHLIEGRDLPQ